MIRHRQNQTETDRKQTETDRKQTAYKHKKQNKMQLIRLTPENSSQFIGHEILFKTRGNHIVKKILGVTDTCVKIDHPDLNDCLQVVSRKVYVLVE